MTLSGTARTAAFAPQTGEVFLTLLTIDHDDLAEPIRVVDNTENVTSNGDEFVAWPFRIALPDEGDDKEVSATLTIGNVSREIGQVIRQISDPPTVDIAVIRADEPDTYELQFPTFTLRNVVGPDEATITGDLILGDITTEPYPQYNFTPSLFPGLF